MNIPSTPAHLVCPLTHQRLQVTSLEQARARISAGAPLARAPAPAAPPVGETDPVLLRADGKAAYPIIDGIPIVLAPEVLRRPGEATAFDLAAPQYAEAYAEMKFYNATGFAEAAALRASGSLLGVPDSESLQHLERLLRLTPEERGSFPQPPRV